jgi:hypothetical protein
MELENFKTVSDRIESTDYILKTFKKYSSRDTIPLSDGQCARWINLLSGRRPHGSITPQTEL